MHGNYTRAEVEAACCFAATCGYGVLSTFASSTGQRTIHHEARGSRVLLFVREQRKQDGRAGGPIGLVLCFWPRDLQRA